MRQRWLDRAAHKLIGRAQPAETHVTDAAEHEPSIEALVCYLFNSLASRENRLTACVTAVLFAPIAHVAQSVEHCVGNVEVDGSNPFVSTIF